MTFTKFVFLGPVLLFVTIATFSQGPQIEPGSITASCFKCEDMVVELVSPEYPMVGYGAHKWSGEVAILVSISEEGTVLKAKAVSGHLFFRSLLEKSANASKFTSTKKKRKRSATVIYRIMAPRS